MLPTPPVRALEASDWDPGRPRPVAPAAATRREPLAAGPLEQRPPPSDLTGPAGARCVRELKSRRGPWGLGLVSEVSLLRRLFIRFILT